MLLTAGARTPGPAWVGVVQMAGQSLLLAGFAPPEIASGAATLQTISAEDDYFREVKRRKQVTVPTATADDVSAAEVIIPSHARDFAFP